MTVFSADQLDVEVFAPAVRPVLRELIGVRVAAKAPRLAPLHFLIALARSAPTALQATLAPFLRNGQLAAQMVTELLRLEAQANKAAVGIGTLTTATFTAGAVELLETIARELPLASQKDAAAAAATMVRAVCAHLSENERAQLRFFFDANAVAAAVPIQGAQPSDPPMPPDAIVAPARWVEEGREALRSALQVAADAGAPDVSLGALAVACLDSKNVRVQRTLSMFKRGRDVAAASTALRAKLRRGAPAQSLPLLARSFSAPAQRALVAATRGPAPAGTGALLLAVLRQLDDDPGLRDELQRGFLGLDVRAAIDYLDRALAQEPDAASAKAHTPVGLLGQDLLAHVAALASDRLVDRPELCAELARGLWAQDRRCVLLHGEPGTGCTTLVELLARQVADGKVAFLRDVPFVRFDAQAPTEGAVRGWLASAVHAGGKSESVVAVVEHVLRLAEVDRHEFARVLQSRGGLRLVGVAHSADARRLLAMDPAFAAQIWPIEVGEPDRDLTVKIVDRAAGEIEASTHTRLPRELLPLALRWADTYATALARPGRVIDLLRGACEEASFAAAQAGGTAAVVDRATLARCLARKTGFPVEQLLGTRSADYYREALRQRVFGQGEAIDKIADGLALAHGGARVRGRPAGVFLFVGQTGTGKTLLAKEIATLWSPSAKFSQWAMGDFTEQHSVARLVGAPPGYVGHEAGGGLVEALLANPSALLLFDEADKAHPKVWDVLLQLLSEGWVEDAARRVARADRAFIVLTSNAGQDVIDRGLASGLRLESIVEQVLRELRQARDQRTGQPYFRPEFFGRLDDVIVFRPLDADALRAIALHEIQLAVAAQREKRGVVLQLIDDTWDQLAQFLTDCSADDKKHGRALAQVLSRHVLAPLAGLPWGDGGELSVRVQVERPPARPGYVALYDGDGNLLARSATAN